MIQKAKPERTGAEMFWLWSEMYQHNGTPCASVLARKVNAPQIMSPETLPIYWKFSGRG